MTEIVYRKELFTWNDERNDTSRERLDPRSSTSFSKAQTMIRMLVENEVSKLLDKNTLPTHDFDAFISKKLANHAALDLQQSGDTSEETIPCSKIQPCVLTSKV